MQCSFGQVFDDCLWDCARGHQVFPGKVGWRQGWIFAGVYASPRCPQVWPFLPEWCPHHLGGPSRCKPCIYYAVWYHKAKKPRVCNESYRVLNCLCTESHMLCSKINRRCPLPSREPSVSSHQVHGLCVHQLFNTLLLLTTRTNVPIVMSFSPCR